MMMKPRLAHFNDINRRAERWEATNIKSSRSLNRYSSKFQFYRHQTRFAFNYSLTRSTLTVLSYRLFQYQHHQHPHHCPHHHRHYHCNHCHHHHNKHHYHHCHHHHQIIIVFIIIVTITIMATSWSVSKTLQCGVDQLVINSLERNISYYLWIDFHWFWLLIFGLSDQLKRGRSREKRDCQ